MLAVFPELFPAIFTALFAVAMATLFFCCWRKKATPEETNTEKQGVLQLKAPQNGTVKEDKQGSYGSQEEVGDFSAVQRETEILRSYRKPPPPKNRGRQSRAGRAVTRSTENLDIFTEINEDDEMHHFADSSVPDKDTATSPVKVTVTNGDDSLDGKPKDLDDSGEGSLNVSLRDKAEDKSSTRSSMLADIELTLAAMHKDELESDTEVKDEGEKDVDDKEVKGEEGQEEEMKADDTKENAKDEEVEVEKTKEEKAEEDSKVDSAEESKKEADVKDTKELDKETIEKDKEAATKAEDVVTKDTDKEEVKDKETLKEVDSTEIVKEEDAGSENVKEKDTDEAVEKVTEASDSKTDVDETKPGVDEKKAEVKDSQEGDKVIQPEVSIPTQPTEEAKIVEEPSNVSDDSSKEEMASQQLTSSSQEAAKEEVIQKSSGSISESAVKVDQSAEASKAESDKPTVPEKTEPISVEVTSPTATEQSSPTQKIKKGPKVSPKPSRIALAKAGIVLPTAEPSKVQKVAEAKLQSSQSVEGPSSPSAASGQTRVSITGANKDSLEQNVNVSNKTADVVTSTSKGAAKVQEEKSVSEGEAAVALDSNQSSAQSIETVEAKSPEETSLPSKPEPSDAAVECPTSPSVSSTEKDSTRNISKEQSEMPKESQDGSKAAADQQVTSPESPTTAEGLSGDKAQGDIQSSGRRESEDGGTKGKSKIPVRAGSKPRTTPPKSTSSDKDEGASK